MLIQCELRYIYNVIFYKNRFAESNRHTIFALWVFRDKKSIHKPEFFASYLKKIKKLNGEQSTKILYYNEEDFWKEITSLSPLCEDIFANIKDTKYSQIMRGDVGKYALAGAKGWSYTDFDVKHSIPIDKIWKAFPEKNIVFGLETVLNFQMFMNTVKEPIREGIPEIPYRVANYMYLCRKKNHPFWTDLLTLIAKRVKEKSPIKDYDVIYLTGPEAVTQAVWDNIHKYTDIAVISREEHAKWGMHIPAGTWRKDKKN